MLALLQLLMVIGLFAFGTLLVPDVGEARLLSNALGKTSPPATCSLRLFESNTTPAEGDTAATYTEATAPGYAAKSLTNNTYWTVATATGTTSATGAEQTWTFTGAGNAIYGYYFVDTADSTLLWAERAGASFTPTNNGDTYKVTPYIELA